MMTDVISCYIVLVPLQRFLSFDHCFHLSDCCVFKKFVYTYGRLRDARQHPDYLQCYWDVPGT